MKIDSINSNWFSKFDLRFDAPFHLKDGVRTRRIIEDYCPFELTTIEEEALELFKGNIHKRVYVTSPNHGVMFYSASDLFKSETETGKYVSKKYSPHLSELELKKDWILITRSGTLGKVVFTTQDHEKRIGTDDLVRILPAERRIKGGYLFAFLSSKFGHSLLTQSGYGGVVKHIEPSHLKHIKIPILPDTKQKYVHDLIIASTSLRVEANQLLTEAKKSFYNSIGVSMAEVAELNASLERNISLSHSINIRELSIHSFRGRNYSIRKQKIIALLSRGKYDKLGDVLERPLERGGRFKRVDVSKDSKNAVVLLNQGDIFDLKPVGKTISKKAIKNWEAEITTRGLILIPALGTLGENEIFSRVKFCYGHLEGQTVAEGLLRVVANSMKIDPAYLYAVLSSDLWFRVLRNSVHGTNLLGYIYSMLHSYPIPRLDPSQEKSIGDSVREAHENLTKALKYEAEAIDLVEKEIESWQKL